MPSIRSDARWGRAVFYGVLAELSTIVVVIAVVATHSARNGGPMTDTTSGFATTWGAIIGILGGAFFVYAFARWLGSALNARYVSHGLVVAGGAILLNLASTLGGAHGFDILHLWASALKLIAGAIGGWVASRNV
jgi:hypothetical protein